MIPFRLGPLWVVAAVVVAVGLVVLKAVDVRLGGYLMAAVMLGCALTRGVWPQRSGALAVRSRTQDVAFYLILALALVVIFRIVKLS